MLTYKNLFEISVYRLSENSYYDKMNDHIAHTNQDKEYPIDEGFLRKQFGGDWRYNEIIGFLRFYRCGQDQIRCEYWETDAKKKVRTRKKLFSQISDSYCTERFSRNSSNEELAKTMKNAVEHCENRLKNRTLDRELFDTTVDLIDWKVLLS